MTPHSVLLETAHAAISILVCPQMYLWKTLVQWSTGSGAMPLAFESVSRMLLGMDVLDLTIVMQDGCLSFR